MLMKKRNFYILGCSHASGCELEGDNIGHNTDFNLNNSFAALLGKKLGYNVINLAFPGGSNDSIFRMFHRLVDATEHEDPESWRTTAVPMKPSPWIPNPKFDQDQDVVFASWTGEERIEVFDVNNSEWLNFSVGASLEASKFNKNHRDFYNSYIRFWCSADETGYNNKLKNILALNSYANYRGAVVINHNSFAPFDFMIKDTFLWLNAAGNFADWAASNNYRQTPQWYHYGVDAHKDYADKLYAELIAANRPEFNQLRFD